MVFKEDNLFYTSFLVLKTIAILVTGIIYPFVVAFYGALNHGEEDLFK